MTDPAKKVLISDPLPAETRAILERAGLEVVEGADQIEAHLGSISGWILRSGSKITAEVLDQAKELKCICRAGAGVDNIDCDAAANRGVLVMNTPSANSNAAAEHALGLMFAMARNIPQGHGGMANGEWGRKALVGIELEGKTLVVLGLGKIGQRVCRKASALGMSVIGCDPFVSAADASACGAELVELDDALIRADFITLHPPLNDSTLGMVNHQFIGRCKDGVRIVNVSRGPVIDEASLLAGLESGKGAGAALDVFAEEPPVADHPFRTHPKIICTPHLGASTVEAQDNVGTQSAHQVVGFLTESRIEHAVNAPGI